MRIERRGKIIEDNGGENYGEVGERLQREEKKRSFFVIEYYSNAYMQFLPQYS